MQYNIIRRSNQFGISTQHISCHISCMLSNVGFMLAPSSSC